MHYRDLNSQNDWIQKNVFDAMRNYLYCCLCIRSALGISKQRIARQRFVKRQQSTLPIVQMSKADMERQDLSRHILMPLDVEQTFVKWWTSLQPTSLVDVRYLHGRHGNAGKPSNSAKLSVKEAFIEFLDINSQPNGRSHDSSGSIHYLTSKFRTISESVVREFTRSQEAIGRQCCSNGSSTNWLELERPKVTICPHQEDHYDTFPKAKETIRGRQTTLNRVRQASASTPEKLTQLEGEMRSLQEDLAKHHKDACESLSYFIQCTKNAFNNGKKLLSLRLKLRRAHMFKEEI